MAILSKNLKGKDEKSACLSKTWRKQNQVKDIKNLFECEPFLANKDTLVKDVVKDLIEHPVNRDVYVVDNEGHPLGSILMDILGLS
ncbi:MAG: hypothetical protein U9Q21_02255 [Candidatus Auribacterota bacterium]|nr:hypothetical protein [Candidatus Auribacterota bacterium]